MMGKRSRHAGVEIAHPIGILLQHALFGKVSKTVLDSSTSVSSEKQMGQAEEVNKQNGKRKIDKKQLHGQVYTIIVAVQVYSNN
jgi:hypothetical protein